VSGYIKLNKSVRTSAKFIRLRALTRLSVRELLGALAMLWMIGDDQAVMVGTESDDKYRDALLPGWSPEMIDAEVEVEGFGKALCDKGVRWAKESRGGLILPEFEKHNDSAKQRAQAAERMRRFRSRQSSRSGDVTRNQEHSFGDSPVTRHERTQSRTEQSNSSTIQNSSEQNSMHAPPAGLPGDARPSADAAAAETGEAPPPLVYRMPAAEFRESFDRVRALMAAGVAPSSSAAELAEHPNATTERVRWLVDRVGDENPKNPGGWIRRGIVEGWKPPRDYWTEPKVKLRLAKRAARAIRRGAS